MLIALAVATTACGGGASREPNALSGKFDVGGRSLYLECSGTGTPTVVMDAGLGNTHTTWAKVAPAVSKLTRTCTYDRANRGTSDDAAKPRTSADVIADLHALLGAASLEPPYVLVGHSYGGDNLRLFAATYPAETAGMVLVDPTPTTFLHDECSVVDATVCGELRTGFSAASNPEGLDFEKSAAQVDQAATLPQVPLVVLAATAHKQAAITNSQQERQIEVLWQKDQQNLASTVPGGTVQVVSGGHDIQTLHPDSVISAVKNVVGAVRSAP